MSKFKEGDTVRINKGGWGHSDSDIGKVIGFSSSDSCIVEVFGRHSTSAYAPGVSYVDSSLELVEEKKEGWKFKPGDKVRVIKTVVSSDGEFFGKEYLIKELDLDKRWYRLLTEEHSSVFVEDQLELVETENKKEEPKIVHIPGNWFEGAYFVSEGLEYPKDFSINSLKTKKTFMERLRTVSIKVRAAFGDEKANQIVAGLRNDDLSLTSKGREVILEALADEVAGMKALNEKATEIIEEAKKEDK